MEKIAFFHMNQLGDLLFSLPLLEAARREKTGARLYSIARPELAPLLQTSGLVDQVMVKSRGGFLERLRLIHALRREKFSSAVLFSESPDSLVAAAMAGIPRRFGFRSASLSFLLTATTRRSGVPSLSNNAALAALFGLQKVAVDYTGMLKVPAEEKARVQQWCALENIASDRLVVISTGASKRRRDKCWPDEHWISLVRRMQDEHMVPVLCGSPAEKPAMERLAQKISSGTRIFAAPDGILSFAALLSQACLFVGIDSGAMHLAASLGVPVIAIFGKTDPAQIGPRPLARHAVLKNDRIETIVPDDVWAAVCARIA